MVQVEVCLALEKAMISTDDKKFVIKIKTVGKDRAIVKWLKDRNVAYECIYPESFVLIKMPDGNWEVFDQETTYKFDIEQDAVVFALRWA
jgi:hypothetical protein